MSDTVNETHATLDRIAEEIEQVTKTTSTPQAVAVADQMIHRASAAMADVHAHAMARVAGMRTQIDDLEKTIIEARQRAELHMQKFMQLVTDGEESIRHMEMTIARIGDHLVSQ